VFAGISIQPSEIVRPWLIVSFAALAAHYKRVDWRYLVSSIIVLGIPVGILLLQPDLGSAILLSLGWLGVSLAMKPSVKQIGVGIMASLIVLPLIWLTLQPYQKSRITGFINPHSDPQGIGYNVLQSQLAVGSGQLLGRGLGRGPQSHLQFLPERHTDFIFASLAEELGFVGSMVTLAIYGWLFAFLVLAQRLASDQFATYTLSGIFISLFGQFFINVGMNLGLMPVTGVTLPLLSYGGSSIIATCMTLGLVNAMVMQRTSSEATMRIR
jgi:rod shape determining protein RodA